MDFQDNCGRSETTGACIGGLPPPVALRRFAGTAACSEPGAALLAGRCIPLPEPLQTAAALGPAPVDPSAATNQFRIRINFQTACGLRTLAGQRPLAGMAGQFQGAFSARTARASATSRAAVSSGLDLRTCSRRTRLTGFPSTSATS